MANQSLKEIYQVSVGQAGTTFQKTMTNIATYIVQSKLTANPEEKLALREKYLGKTASTWLSKAEEIGTRVKESEVLKGAIGTAKANASRLKDALYKLGTENMVSGAQAGVDTGLEK